MGLLHPASFASVVASSKDSLDRISKIVSRYCGEDIANKFLSACKNLDYTTANNILDKTVEKLTGETSLSMALNAFAEKFPELDLEVASVISESDKVKAIAKYSKEIQEIIK